MVSHPILLIEGLVLSLDVKWYMSLEGGAEVAEGAVGTGEEKPKAKELG